MVTKIIKNLLDEVEKQFQRYGIKTTFVFNSDLSMISEYSRNYSIRRMFKDGEELIDPSYIETLKSQSMIVGLYNFGAIKRVEDRLNNINFEAVFTPQDFDNSEMKKIVTLPDSNGVTQLVNLVRDNNIANPNFQVRDMIYAQIPFSFKIITSDLSLAYDIQMVYLSQLMRNRTIEISLDFGDNTETLEFDYMTKFEDIDDFSQIDASKYGGLYQIDFTGTVTGPIFSMYSTTTNKWIGKSHIDMSITPRSVS